VSTPTWFSLAHPLPRRTDVHERRTSDQPGTESSQPAGEAKEDWEIFVLLAKKLDSRIRLQVTPGIWDDMRSVTPSMFGATNARIDIPGSVHWPCRLRNTRDPDSAPENFYRQTGLGPSWYRVRPPAEVADAQYPFTLMTGRVIFHYHTRTQTDRPRCFTTRYRGLCPDQYRGAKKLG